PASIGEQAQAPKTAAAPAALDSPEPPESGAHAMEPTRGAPVEPPVQLGSSDGLTLRRLVVATGVTDREPVGPAGAFDAGSPVYAFVDTSNASAAGRELLVTFEGPEGRTVGHVRLDIP